MSKKPYLTKSTFLGAGNCKKWLWNIFHNRPPYEDAAAGSVLDIGIRIGQFAHKLFPGGVEISEAPWEHEQAAARTRELMADENVPAIFEAAFEHENVRIRVDVLERLPNGGWGIREVKSAGSVRAKNGSLKEKYARDVAVQLWVAEGCGLDIASVELVHLNKEYKRSEPGISGGNLFIGIVPEHFFTRDEVLEEIRDQGRGAGAEISGYLGVLAGKDPIVEPSKKLCNGTPGGLCPFWEACTADKPDDWIDGLYYAMGKQIMHLKSEGKHRISDMAIEDALKPAQKRMVLALEADVDIFEDTLAAQLEAFGPPAIHLDFEYVAMVALPLYPGVRPFEKIAFQFSAHRLSKDGSIEHMGEFLAEGNRDPRREFSEKLIALLEDGDEPIVAYNAAAAEQSVIKGLMDLYPDLAEKLGRINERIEDLLIVMRNNVMLRRMIGKHTMAGSGLFSLKNVAPAFIDGFSYDDLGVVSHGGAAVEAFFQLVTGELPEIEENVEKRQITRDELRQSMLAYCAKDTEATTLIHRKLMEKTKGGPSAP